MQKQITIIRVIYHKQSRQIFHIQSKLQVTDTIIRAQICNEVIKKNHGRTPTNEQNPPKTGFVPVFDSIFQVIKRCYIIIKNKTTDVVDFVTVQYV